MICHCLTWSIVALLICACGLPAEPARNPPKVIAEVTWVDGEVGTPAEFVIRSQDQLATKLNRAKPAPLAKVDFTKHMVVVIHTGTINYHGVKLNIEKLEVSKQGDILTVHWKYRPYFGGAAPPPVQGNLILAAVVDAFDGEIRFKKEVHQFKGTPPPSAPPPSAPPRKP